MSLGVFIATSFSPPIIQIWDGCALSSRIRRWKSVSTYRSITSFNAARISIIVTRIYLPKYLFQVRQQQPYVWGGARGKKQNRHVLSLSLVLTSCFFLKIIILLLYLINFSNSDRFGRSTKVGIRRRRRKNWGARCRCLKSFRFCCF